MTEIKQFLRSDCKDKSKQAIRFNEMFTHR